MEINYAIPFLTLFIGILIGNRLALGRDKRREFNQVSDQLFEKLEVQKISLLSGNFPSSANETDELAFISMRRLLPFYKTTEFEKSVQNYIQAKHECGHFSDGIYKLDKPLLLISAIERLQKYMPHI